MICYDNIIVGQGEKFEFWSELNGFKSKSEAIKN